MLRPPSLFAPLLLAAGLAAGIAACDAPAPGDAAARVEGWSLTPERLADLLVLAQPLPLDSMTVAQIVDEWIVRAALASFELQGGDLTGPEATEASLWMEEREALLTAAREADDRYAGAPDLAKAEAEFAADSLRLLAHILRRVNASTSAEERELQRRTAEEILAELRAGGGWPRAVARSEDAATRDESGLLGLFRVDELPPGLSALGGRLEPGQVSSVVETTAGFHILYRPRFQDVAQLYADLLNARRTEAWEALAAEEAMASLRMDLPAAALTRTRELAAAGGPTPTRDRVMAEWEDGQLTEEVVGRYLAAVAPEARAGLAEATNEQASQFLRQVAVREARVARARSQGLAPDAGMLSQLTGLHQEEVRSWRSAVPTSQGEAAARNALGRYMEQLVARQAQVPPAPPVLRWWVLSRVDWSVDSAGVREAVRRAEELVAAAAGTPAS